MSHMLGGAAIHALTGLGLYGLIKGGKLKAAGIQFVDVDKKAFYDATQPIRDKYGAKYGALLKQIQAS